MAQSMNPSDPLLHPVQSEPPVIHRGKHFYLLKPHSRPALEPSMEVHDNESSSSVCSQNAGKPSTIASTVTRTVKQ
jgi:hypothetical protein